MLTAGSDFVSRKPRGYLKPRIFEAGAVGSLHEFFQPADILTPDQHRREPAAVQAPGGNVAVVPERAQGSDVERFRPSSLSGQARQQDPFIRLWLRHLRSPLPHD